MKTLFRLAASLIAASVLAACSGGTGQLPPIAQGKLAAPPHIKSMVDIVCNGASGSDATACYHQQPAGQCCGPAPGGYSCVENCSGQLPVGVGGGGGCLANGGCGGVVACVGTATQCENQPCNQSEYAIGSITTAPDGNTFQVTDINSIQELDNAGHSWNVGWIYQGTETRPGQPAVTVRYMQGDLMTAVGVSWSVSVGIISVAPASGNWTPLKHYPGWPIPGAKGTLAAQKCETLGGILA